MNSQNIGESYDNFIGTYTNVFPEGFCEQIIKLTEHTFKTGVGYTREHEAPKHKKDDLSINGNMLENGEVIEFYRKQLQQCFLKYTSQYYELQNYPLSSTDMKIQRTGAGQGYHVWHSEQGPGVNVARALVFIVYLNSLEPNDGGETEFLYLRKRVLPQKNTLIIWPAGFTHTHRGNPVLSDKYKYIITGWFHIT